MKIDVVTLFPGMVDVPLSDSIVGRARKDKLLKLNFENPRDFTLDKHKTVDNKMYGGGTGMLMMAEPVFKALEKVKKKDSFVVLLSPRGAVFNQKTALSLAKKKHLIFICGHYEGIDDRIGNYADLELSIGDYVLTGGEPAAVAVIDSVTRLLPGVLKKADATVNESFSFNLLEAPQYTRPEVWKDLKVPKVLLSGNHKLIKEWKKDSALEITKKIRPDLLKEDK
ncbi:MAG: tRNA (guanosine(37)-N1)-methyltransferase TrmD [Elusimicrobiales bacterium]|nr:tRNA (guanosine(37)-N1)-methyltransferase TrmD [Elusimicrobiales bacterium]MCK5357245.1 tRNA (guanosine(37)-N1)-methyltransferase TrmD [Elusimicrobiales bacterium]MCK5584259.1 tRNA (guanosine(37)-N1)-methyltransferase TrmD [Elusimicrobiales bacterium]